MMSLAEAVRALWPWRWCNVSQVWEVDEFPRDAVTCAFPAYNADQHRHMTIESICRAAMRKMFDRGERL